MPRKVRDYALETRTARARLRVAHKPYYRMIEPGLHLGYRKNPSGPGSWVARRYRGAGAYAVENLRTANGGFVLADDFSEPDGERVLSFGQAQELAKRPAPTRGAYTVADALDDYLAFLEGDGRSAHSVRDARLRARRLIRPALGNAKVAALTSERLRRFLDGMVQAAPLRRVRQHLAASTAEALRARRSSANRVWKILAAALSFAFREGAVDSDAAWRKVRPFRSVDVARVRYLTVADAQRLINACDPDFRALVQTALQTGCRFGELARLQVQDFHVESGTLAVRQSKSGKPRHAVLTDEGSALFAQLCAGRTGDEVLLLKADGEPWRASQQGRRMRETCARARIVPPINFHGLRHTWASLSAMAGMPLLVVARNLGHADTRMVEKHYGHLAPSYVADAVRKSAPRFGAVEPSNVRPLR